MVNYEFCKSNERFSLSGEHRSSRGIAVVSANYRMYPAAKYPQYIEDTAKAVAWGLTHIREWIDGYIFDAGQPTVHYNILRERGIDPKSVRVDEAAPIYYLEGEQVRVKKQFFLIMVSDNDIPGRREQNELMIQTMKTHQYEDFQIDYRIIKGYAHTEYVNVKDAKGCYPYVEKLYEFIKDWNFRAYSHKTNRPLDGRC